MITDIRRWPGRLMVAVAFCYAGTNILILAVLDIFMLALSGDPIIFFERRFFKDETNLKLIFSALVLLIFLVSLSWPRIFIWPTLVMLSMILLLYAYLAYSMWADHAYALFYFFAELLTNIFILIPALFLALLIPAAWRLLRPERSPPPKDPNRPE